LMFTILQDGDPLMHCSRVVLLAETVVATTKIHQNNSSIPQYRTCPYYHISDPPI
jgi:hypothetical protein